jgi:hypothetical protein
LGAALSERDRLCSGRAAEEVQELGLEVPAWGGSDFGPKTSGWRIIASIGFSVW